jgi:ubiquinone/menaquinone biosynthesis C-methylase UbiE
MISAVGPDRFVGRDQEYLRDVQYRDPAKLTARADLHTKYGTATVGWFGWVLAQIDWPTAADVLEVGCGPGWLWAEETADLPGGLRLTLIDLSPGMVAVAADRARSTSRIAVVEARVADAQELPFDDDAFDVVIANHMLYHVPEPQRAVAEFARVLRPDGVLVAATNGARHLRQLWEVRSRVFGGPPTSVLPEIFGSVTGAAILRRAFSRVEWRDYEDTLRCTDPDDVVAFLISAPPGEDASPAQLADLRLTVKDRFDAGGGVFTISKETGVLLARDPLHRLTGRTSR